MQPLKRILLIVLILCLPILSGCAKEPNFYDVAVLPIPNGGETFAEVQWPVVPTIFPLAPPHLFVSDGKNAVEAWRGTSSWFTEDENGMGSGVNSDSMHPLDCKDTLPSLEITKKTTVILKFEAAPSKITVKRYKLNATDYDDYDEITISGDSFEAKAGDYVYEIIASWSGQHYSGTVHYAFRTEK